MFWIFIAGYAAALWGMYHQLPQLDLTGLLIFFALLLVLLQLLLWRFLPAVFYKEEEMEDEPENDPHILEIVSGFGRYFDTDEHIDVKDLKLHVVDGGVLKLEYETQREIGEDIVGEFSAAAFGFVALVERLEYPVKELDVSFVDCDGREGRFSVDADWAREMSTQDLGQEEYLERVGQTIEVEGGEFKVPAKNVQ